MKNNQITQLIVELKKASSTGNSKLWRAVALELEKPTRIRRAVNLTKIDRYAKENETIIVPGKVLAGGELNKKVTVVAYQFSEQASAKIKEKGTIMSISEALKSNLQTKNVRVLG